MAVCIRCDYNDPTPDIVQLRDVGVGRRRNICDVCIGEVERSDNARENFPDGALRIRDRRDAHPPRWVKWRNRITAEVLGNTTLLDGHEIRIAVNEVARDLLITRVDDVEDRLDDLEDAGGDIEDLFDDVDDRFADVEERLDELEVP